jgi:hypothetical protein
VCGTDCILWLEGLSRRIDCGGRHFSRWRTICGVRIRSLWIFVDVIPHVKIKCDISIGNDGLTTKQSKVVAVAG